MRSHAQSCAAMRWVGAKSQKSENLLQVFANLLYTASDPQNIVAAHIFSSYFNCSAWPSVIARSFAGNISISLTYIPS